MIIEICFAVISLKIHNGSSLSPLPSAGEMLSRVGKAVQEMQLVCSRAQGEGRGQHKEKCTVRYLLSGIFFLDPEQQVFT